MLPLVTKHFGEIKVDESKIINFSNGLPGFPSLRQFVLLSEQDRGETGQEVFYWLQSVEDGNTAFCLVDMIKVMPEYNPLVEPGEMQGLGNYDPEKFYLYNVAVVPDNIRDMTVNLKAPVVINTANKKGRQVICANDEYDIKHYLFR